MSQISKVANIILIKGGKTITSVFLSKRSLNIVWGILDCIYALYFLNGGD